MDNPSIRLEITDDSGFLALVDLEAVWPDVPWADDQH